MNSPHDSLMRAEKKEVAREEFTKLENTAIKYNNQEITLKEAIDKLRSVTKKHELKVYLLYFVSSGSKSASVGNNGICRIDIHLPEIDRKQPQMYYFIDGKWWWNWRNGATKIRSIETLEADAAVKRFGKEAAKRSDCDGNVYFTTATIKNTEDHFKNN
ncbi:MAG: hypothetical protein LBD80_01105 [Tannerella sp.]|nr:hypothetical protein [Tannerella sp.]